MMKRQRKSPSIITAKRVRFKLADRTKRVKRSAGGAGDVTTVPPLFRVCSRVVMEQLASMLCPKDIMRLALTCVQGALCFGKEGIRRRKYPDRRFPPGTLLVPLITTPYINRRMMYCVGMNNQACVVRVLRMDPARHNHVSLVDAPLYYFCASRRRVKYARWTGSTDGDANTYIKTNISIRDKLPISHDRFTFGPKWKHEVWCVKDVSDILLVAIDPTKATSESPEHVLDTLSNTTDMELDDWVWECGTTGKRWRTFYGKFPEHEIRRRSGLGHRDVPSTTTMT